MTATQHLGIDFIKRMHRSTEIEWHESSIKLYNLLIFVGFLNFISLSTLIQTISIGFNSGLCASQSQYVNFFLTQKLFSDFRHMLWIIIGLINPIRWQFFFSKRQKKPSIVPWLWCMRPVPYYPKQALAHHLLSQLVQCILHYIIHQRNV